MPRLPRCAKECGSDAITYDANNKAVIDQTKCKGCGRCIGACNFDAIYSQCDSANEMLDRKMAEYAAAVCAGRPCFHVSLVQDISPTATATARTMHPSCRISASLHPLIRWRWISLRRCLPECTAAAEQPAGPEPCKARLELPPRQLQGSNPNIEWKATLEQAEKIGMGTRQYVLKKV